MRTKSAVEGWSRFNQRRVVIFVQYVWNIFVYGNLSHHVNGDQSVKHRVEVVLLPHCGGELWREYSQKEVAKNKGYPERFRAAWAKFASVKIIPIAKELQDGGVLKAVSLALQSLDETTLDIVKRANIKFDKFSFETDIVNSNICLLYTSDAADE